MDPTPLPSVFLWIFITILYLLTGVAIYLLILWNICGSKLLLVQIYPLFWQHISMLHQVRRCPRTPSLYVCICVNNHGNWVLNIIQSLWYLARCAKYEIYLWTLALLDPFFVVVWSISCTSLHNILHGRILFEGIKKKWPKWGLTCIPQNHLHCVSPINLTTFLWHGAKILIVQRWFYYCQFFFWTK